MRSNILTNISRAFHMTGFKLKKHSPEIMVVGGVIGGVASAVMACKATTKVDAVLTERNVKLAELEEAKNDPEFQKAFEEKHGVPLTEDDIKKAKLKIKFMTATEFVKLYGPSVVLGGVSIASILAGHRILNKRTVALSAAFNAVNTDFKDYRNRVVERFGEDLDRELKYNIRTKEVEENVVDPETGETKTVTKTVQEAGPACGPKVSSGTERFFMEGNPNWYKDRFHNQNFLIDVQNALNDRLRNNGHVFLNEAYDMLGFDRSAEGQSLGWLYDPKNPATTYIDLGLYDPHDKAKMLFVNGDERSILVTFNTQGNILHNLP